MPVLVAVIVALTLLGGAMRAAVYDSDALSTAGTVFSGIFVQALPFLALGVMLSALIAVFVTPDRLSRWLPQRPVAAVLAAAAGGAALPGCECGSVPIARRLFGQGAVGAAALTFMLAAPAINPVVVVSTVVAFPGQPQMVFARVGASLLTAIVMGMAWSHWGNTDWITRRLPRAMGGQGSRWQTFIEAARHDFIQAASYLVIGAGHLLLGVVVMAVLAVVLSLCSEADAFVAASLTMVPLVPRLAFLVVGPAVDIKLFAMQSGMFGRAFALRFAPATLVVATVAATAIGVLVLGPSA
jgi:uncharacterized membrane protein YraQ (UPF0718 family)